MRDLAIKLGLPEPKNPYEADEKTKNAMEKIKAKLKPKRKLL
jgi:hypothetical protein